MAETKIEWATYTFNPWWGCSKVSPGCKNCYAERDSTRYGFDLWGPNGKRRFFGDAHWKTPVTWNAKAERERTRRRVFVASMADVLETTGDPEADFDLDLARERLWKLITATPWLDWLILTKRPENFSLLPSPLPRNVWLGVSVETQVFANERIPKLLEVDAAVRFVSYEPALGPIDFQIAAFNGADSLQSLEGLHWIIVGGESGPRARLFQLEWARSTVEQCKLAGVACFVKQLGSLPSKQVEHGYANEGQLVPYALRSRKGNDMDEWPEDLRVREFPEPRS